MTDYERQGRALDEAMRTIEMLKNEQKHLSSQAIRLTQDARNAEANIRSRFERVAALIERADSLVADMRQIINEHETATGVAMLTHRAS